MYTYIYIYYILHSYSIGAEGTLATLTFRRLPDGVGTNGVVAEGPQFPLMNFHGKMLQNIARFIGDLMWVCIPGVVHRVTIAPPFDDDSLLLMLM